MKLSEISTIGNIGAGTMGHATALQFFTSCVRRKMEARNPQHFN